MRSQAGPSSKEIKTVKELEKFISSDDYSIVGKKSISLFNHWKAKVNEQIV